MKILTLTLSCCLLLTIKANAYGPIGHIALTDELTRALPTNSIFKKCMEAHPKIARWGAEGPDIPAGKFTGEWMSMFHYFRVGTYAKTLLQNALVPIKAGKTFEQLNDSEKIKLAWAAGWITHICGDFGSHGIYVAPEAGYYLANHKGREKHGDLEEYSDSYLFHKYNLSNGFAKKMEEFNIGSYDNYALDNLLSDTYSGKPNTYQANNSDPRKKSLKTLTTAINFANETTNEVYGISFDLGEALPIYYSLAFNKADLVPLKEVEKHLGNGRLERIEESFRRAIEFGLKYLGEAEKDDYSSFIDNWNLDVGENSFNKTTYTIKTKTGMNSLTNLDPGTGSNVYVRMRSKSGKENSYAIEEGGGYLDVATNVNDFANNFTDYFHFFPNDPDFEPQNVESISIHKDGIDGWQLMHFTIYVCGEEVLHVNTNGIWLDGCITETPVYNVSNGDLVPDSKKAQTPSNTNAVIPDGVYNKLFIRSNKENMVFTAEEKK
jgi:hypothetical protein